MTLPSGNNNPPISIADLNAEFGLGNSLAAYQNQRWYKSDNSRGYFSSGVIKLDDFYGTRVNSPVVAGNVTITSSQNYTIPMFNNLTVTAVSGQGGQGGINGNCAGAGSGASGGVSSLADYVQSSTGAGGAPNGNAGSSTSASVSFSITDANQASILARYGQVKYAGIGAGGAGGTTGYNTRSSFVCTSYNYYYGVPSCSFGYTAYYCDSATGGGSAGANGYVSVSWT